MTMSTEAAPNQAVTANPAATLAPQNQAAPQPDPAFLRPPVGAPGGPPIPQTIPLTVDEYQRLRGLESQFVDFQRQQQAAFEAEQAKANELLAAKGQIEEAFTSERNTWQSKLQKQQDEFTKLRESYHGEKINAELGEALTGVVFAGPDEAARAEAAKMLRTLLRNDLDAIPGPDGSVAVVDKASRRPAAEVLRERLSDPKLAFFFASTNRGGSGTDGTRPPANPQHSGPPSLLEEMVARQNSEQTLFAGVGLGPKPR